MKFQVLKQDAVSHFVPEQIIYKLRSLYQLGNQNEGYENQEEVFNEFANDIAIQQCKQMEGQALNADNHANLLFAGCL